VLIPTTVLTATPGGGSGVQLIDYVEQTSTVTFVGETTVVTSNSFIADGTSKYEIEFFCALVALFGNPSNLNLREDPSGANTDLGIIAQLSDGSTQDALTVSRILIPTAGSHQYRITATRVSGSGTPQLTAGVGYMPMFIKVMKLG